MRVFVARLTSLKYLKLYIGKLFLVKKNLKDEFSFNMKNTCTIPEKMRTKCALNFSEKYYSKRKLWNRSIISMILMHKIGAQNLATLSVILCSKPEKKQTMKTGETKNWKEKKGKKWLLLLKEHCNSLICTIIFITYFALSWIKT